MLTQTEEHVGTTNIALTATNSLTGTSNLKKNSDEPSLFKDNLLEVKHRFPEVHIAKHDYVISAVLFVLFIFFVWLYVFNIKTIDQGAKNFFQFGPSGRRSREGATIGNRVALFLSLIFVTTLSILTGRLLDYYHIKLFSLNIPDTIIIAVLIILIYTLKFMVIKLAGLVFKLQNEANDYILQIISFCNILGLFLLPVILFLSFLKQLSPLIFIYTGVTLTGIFLIIRTVNAVFLGLNSSKVSKFYLFIYLCALEILPFVIIIKLIIIRIR